MENKPEENMISGDWRDKELDIYQAWRKKRGIISMPDGMLEYILDRVQAARFIALEEAAEAVKTIPQKYSTIDGHKSIRECDALATIRSLMKE